MKEPRVVMEWTCDGIGCDDVAGVEVHADTPVSDARVLIEALGCAFLGRSTFFCRKCATNAQRGGE